MLKETLICLLSGMLVGIIFALVRLPVPAPPVIPPVFAILGITVGYMIVQKYILGG